MKGIVFNVVEQVVTEEFGPDTWDALLEEAGLLGAYTSLGTYPDEELAAIVSAASSKLELPVDDVLRFVGRRGFRYLAARHPQYVTDRESAPAFLQSLNSVVHPEIRKLMRDAAPPDFEVVHIDDTSMEMEYRSARGLCMLAEGFALGVADHFGEGLSVRQATCTHRGDPVCTLVLTWPR